MIYMDAAATAKYTNVDDIIVNTITTAMRDSWMNPSSLYATSIKDKVNKCRANIAKFIGAKPDEIYFCSGASEANNWAIKGWVDQVRNDIDKKSDELYLNGDNEWERYARMMPIILASTIEHKSILHLLNYGNLMALRHPLNVNEYGMIDYDLLEDELKTYDSDDNPVLVTVCMANNEIGTLQNIKKISELVHKYNGVLHTDATQALGKISIDVEQLGVDLMSVSGHKISSTLRGIGFLYKKNGINIQPLIYGSQESGLRGGTENTYGIIGLSKALEYCDMSIPTMETLCRKRDYFIDRLVKEFSCKLNGHSVDRLPNNVNVTFPQNITGESLLYMLDLSDVKVSTSSACNSKSIEPSYVLKAIGLTDEQAMKSIRFTLPSDVTYEQIDKVIIEIDKSIKLIGMES